MAEPLWPPKGSCAPASAASGSVVGWPSGPIAQPSGMDLPSRLCSWISPRAVAAEAWSNTIGGRPSRGQANAIGLVPNSGLVPPAGATVLVAAVKANATRPCSARRSTSGHSAAMWNTWRIASAAMPWLRARSASGPAPICSASGAKP